MGVWSRKLLQIWEPEVTENVRNSQNQKFGGLRETETHLTELDATKTSKSAWIRDWEWTKRSGVAI